MKDRFETFAGSIVELNRYLQKIKDIEMKKFGLRASHTMCLYYLGRYDGGLTATQLTELCKEDKAAISRCLGQLIEKKLVSCQIPENKRSYRTVNYLTEEGKRVVDKINNRVEVALSNGGNGLSDEQRRTFYDSMEIIIDNLAKYISREEAAL